MAVALLVVSCGAEPLPEDAQPERGRAMAVNAMPGAPGVTMPESFGANPSLPGLFRQKVRYFAQLPPMNGGVAFVGDSLTDFAPWPQLFPGIDQRNFGISGDTTAVLLHRLAQVIDAQPAKVFLLIGTNDLGNDRRGPAEITGNIGVMLGQLGAGLPDAEIYLQSVLPRETALNPWVLQLNEFLRSLAAERKVHFVDLYAAFVVPPGRLDPAATMDGVHLNGPGYERWRAQIEALVRE
jgi:lysophospholipase L1-like esterase